MGVSSSSWVVFLSDSFDKLKQDEERLKKFSLVYIFSMAWQKEEWERGMNTTYNTIEFSTDKWHHTSSILLAAETSPRV